MITRLIIRPSASRYKFSLQPCPPTPFIPPAHLRRHLFSSSRTLCDSTPANHYEVLSLPPTCTPAQLKKQFYNLSKETHPDLNPNNPAAGERFSQISDSYSVLADPEKRRRYDRDVLRHQQSTKYRGRSYAGSRPASGLSKRRGTFRGPPPSFYTHGNPNERNARQAASNNTSSESQSQGQGQTQAGTFSGSAYSEFASEFDPQSTFKTQTVEDSRRDARRSAAAAAAQAQMEEDGDFWVRFVVVSGIILLGITVATLVGGMGNPKGGLLKSDGTRRDGGKGERARG